MARVGLVIFAAALLIVGSPLVRRGGASSIRHRTVPATALARPPLLPGAAAP